MTKRKANRAPRFLPVIRNDGQWLIERRDDGEVEHGPFASWAVAKAFIKARDGGEEQSQTPLGPPQGWKPDRWHNTDGDAE